MHVYWKGVGAAASIGLAALALAGILMWYNLPVRGWVCPLGSALGFGILCWGVGRADDKELGGAFRTVSAFVNWFAQCKHSFMFIPLYLWGWFIIFMAIAGFVYASLRTWVWPLPPW